MTSPTPDKKPWNLLPCRSWENKELQSRLAESANRVDKALGVHEKEKLERTADGSADTAAGAYFDDMVLRWEEFRDKAVKGFRLYGSTKGLSMSLTRRPQLFQEWTAKYRRLYIWLHTYQFQGHEFKRILASFLPTGIEMSELLQAFNEVSLCWYEAIKGLHPARLKHAKCTTNESMTSSFWVFIQNTPSSRDGIEQEFKTMNFPSSLLSQEEDTLKGADETLATLRAELSKIWTDDHQHKRSL